jgi:hypothetical protein
VITGWVSVSNWLLWENILGLLLVRLGSSTFNLSFGLWIFRLFWLGGGSHCALAGAGHIALDNGFESRLCLGIGGDGGGGDERGLGAVDFQFFHLFFFLKFYFWI